jgi:hypothetical protein
MCPNLDEANNAKIPTILMYSAVKNVRYPSLRANAPSPRGRVTQFYRRIFSAWEIETNLWEGIEAVSHDPESPKPLAA